MARDTSSDPHGLYLYNVWSQSAEYIEYAQSHHGADTMDIANTSNDPWDLSPLDLEMVVKT